MFYDGLKLMVAGMGTVFIFLALMIFLVNGLAKLLAPFAGMLEPKKETAGAGSAKTKRVDDDKALISAITAAVHQYRKDRNR